MISRAQRLSRATVTIDLSAVAANVRMLRDLVAPAEVWAVVKADGYGHGASAVGGAALAAGATRLCVATWEEARALRDALPEAPVLVMSPLAPGEEADLAGVEVAVSSVESFARLRAAAREPLGVHVKLDTGMGRWGMAEDEARRVADEIVGSSLLRLSGLMSHLSSADDDADHTRRQLERFRRFAEGLPDCPRHVANSAGALGYPEARFDAVRCGIAIYGLSPFGDDSAARGLAPALRLESYVAQLKLLEPGEGAGYGRRFVAERPTWIGLVPAGYADGVPRLLSGRMDVLVRGRRRRVAATISMDQLTFVVGERCDVELGDPVVLIGARRRRADRRRGVGGPQRHDRLRDRVRHRPQAAAGGACHRRRLTRSQISAGGRRWRVPGWSAAACATCCWDGRCSTSTWSSPRIRARWRGGWPVSAGARRFRCRSDTVPGGWCPASTRSTSPACRGSIEDDLGLRDFTVNAIAVSLDNGEFVDPHGGRGDLDRRLLRTVSDAVFVDDPLRLLRLPRIAHELGFDIDPASERLASSQAELASRPSGERIFMEMKRLLGGDRPAEALRLADRHRRARGGVARGGTDARGDAERAPSARCLGAHAARR